jgi:C-terminal processing protease CtpA/Prc
MRKRRIVGAACGAALLALTMAGSAGAQSSGTPWLGVTTQEITDELREGLDYQGSGVIVNRVSADSPAERAGIRKGDVIVSFNSRSVDSPSELTDVVRAARVGQVVSVTVVRDGSRRSLSARLGEWPDDMEDDREFEAPAPPAPPATPRTPRAPAAPRAPRARGNWFEWNGDQFEFPEGGDWTMLRGMGRGRLGVQIQELNSGLGEALEVPGGKGVLVVKVIEDTPAERAGMKAGDVIVRVGDTVVDDIDDLHRAIGDREGRVSITVMRRGARRTVDAQLEDRREVTRIRRGDRPMTLRIPDARRRTIERDDPSREELEQQMRELRDELRDLQRKLEAMDKN